MKKRNNTRKSKTLHFEGAGWRKAEHNGVGNCRIRATFQNNEGEEIYLELIGHKSGKDLYKFPWHISHLFKVKNRKSLHTEEYKAIERERMEFTKQNILNFVNESLGCKFHSVEILNDDWSGFSINGDYKEEN